MKTSKESEQSREDIELDKRMTQILKRQSELDVFRPAGSRRYKNWTEVNINKSDYPEFPF